MTVVKENIVPTLIILVAGLVVSFAALPLANTEFAEGIRGDSTVESTGAEATGAEPAEEDVALSGALVLLPLVKVAAFMGVGAGLTMLVTRLIRRIRGARRKQ